MLRPGRRDHDQEEYESSDEDLHNEQTQKEHATETTVTRQNIAASTQSAPAPPASTWQIIRRNLPGVEQLIMLAFVVACIYYIKTVEVPQRNKSNGPTPKIPLSDVDYAVSISRHSSAPPVDQSDPIIRQMTELISTLNTAFSPTGSHSIAAFGGAVHFEVTIPASGGLGLQATIQTDHTKVDPVETLPSSPLIAALRSIATSQRFIATGDPSQDDPYSSFHIDHKHCAKQRKKGSGGASAHGPSGGRRCRKAEWKSLEHLWKVQPQSVWQLVRQAILDTIEKTIQTGTIDGIDAQQSRERYEAVRQARLFKSGKLQIHIAAQQ